MDKTDFILVSTPFNKLEAGKKFYEVGYEQLHRKTGDLEAETVPDGLKKCFASGQIVAMVVKAKDPVWKVVADCTYKCTDINYKDGIRVVITREATGQQTQVGFHNFLKEEGK